MFIVLLQNCWSNLMVFSMVCLNDRDTMKNEKSFWPLPVSKNSDSGIINGKKIREGVLLEIWNALHRRTGCVAVMRKVQNHRYRPPEVNQLIEAPPLPSPLLHSMEEREK